MFIPSPHGYTWQQRAELWARYRAGDSVREIARALAKAPGALHGVIRLQGGISPRLRARSALAISLEEREPISRALAAGHSYRAIGRTLGRAASTISREVKRHGGRTKYRAVRADDVAWRSARRPKPCRLASRPRLRYLIATKLKLNWSPEQSSGWLRTTYPDEPELHVSHETIYRSLYVQARGVLKKELMKHLRTRRGTRRARASTRKGQGRGRIADAIPISARPAGVEDRAVPGHWEGDLLAGGGNTHIATLVERTSRFTILIKVASKEPASVVPALIRQIRRLPAHVTRSLTWDRGTELAHHKRFTIATGVQVYFCDPSSPWQRGSNENTNGLLRQYFRTGVSLANVTQRDLNRVADQLNGRPRKTLQFRTPAAVFEAAVALID
ncbi:MAG: IS30 family transposase [Gemmatimonadaceae bacterium]|nr:IS30 family transposase [Gemmatimonadaceae bacterium]MCW5826122.1 IS30 family transposase [Gemmatimonadaceae bacterium]